MPKATSPADLRSNMRSLAHLAHIATTRLGAELTAVDILDPATIDYAVSITGITQRVKGVRRSVLTRLGRELNPNWPLDDLSPHYGYKAPDAPYSEQETSALYQWATGLGTDYQRHNATLLLALGLGPDSALVKQHAPCPRRGNLAGRHRHRHHSRLPGSAATHRHPAPPLGNHRV
ncbi:hypothetical protein [Corynebacterium antarcticum]|uniref:hypothetical protein n=1 Tax=Corynebacterium antarcticum TaxID=2800405 RepID=UPI002002F8BE|nr:hypothetical protein [Corynebacterium antarcticum]MCK7660049.1 hypothetical protein [Corynebacterium antarcticum]